MARISIIVPLYNKAPYVTKALDSIAAQTYTDWECIIINDGSTDNSAQIVREWLEDAAEQLQVRGERRGQWRLIDQPNAGVSAARNRGIALAQGDYLAFLDADDWWAPTFLQEMIHLTDQYPDAGIYASNYIYYKPGKTRVGVRQVDGEINYPRSYYENGGQVVWTGAVLLDKKRLEDAAEQLQVRGNRREYFNEEVKLGEDFLLWCQLAMQYSVAFLNKPLAYYNNAVPARLRLTQNLHRPEQHMLWHLPEAPTEDWTKLFDKLRVTGLYPYWLSQSYHDMAANEWKKINWAMLSDWSDAKKYQQLYQLPVCVLRLREAVYQLGSYIKSRLRNQ